MKRSKEEMKKEEDEEEDEEMESLTSKVRRLSMEHHSLLSQPTSTCGDKPMACRS